MEFILQCQKVQNNCQEEFQDTKGVIWNRKSKKNRQHNGQKGKQRSAKYYT